ncbi:radical SAM protein [Dyella choica]|uniref:Radical SAM protein n=1 Tax=Dyella choica TaxID=1927959 RepID=A0A3S0PNL9_9GAMM|nr:radical SAM protein [Dyella choica]RUL75421.1 radical SAM protein [Dyella choica]
MTEKIKLYHVTVLSNFARGFDKYAHAYSKAGISESTFPDRFFLLHRHELAVGVEKASKLLHKLGIHGDRLIVLETEVDPAQLHAHTVSGRGQFIHDRQIALTRIYDWKPGADDGQLRARQVEDVMADSLGLAHQRMHAYADVKPRTISFLPVASACQARCTFCFSKASISHDQVHAKPDWRMIEDWLDLAATRGAERAVITGGGEPTLLPANSLQKLITFCGQRFDKVVLITNAHQLARLPEAERSRHLRALYDAGLRVLAISRHHFDAARNERLMGLHTPVEAVIHTWREHRARWPLLRLRLICVLQRSGVENQIEIERYLSWASRLGVEEVCFKELYVSTSTESVYHDHAANVWSREHQVPLSWVTRFAEERGFALQETLPWGAPVYRGEWLGAPLRIAAYTEPSLYWERTHGIARSWNMMADGRCYVSLEDHASEITREQLA